MIRQWPLRLTLFGTLALFACGGREAGIFQESHYRFKQSATEETTAARKEFRKGERLYRDEKKPSEAIKHFEEAVKLAPNWRYYLELANAYVDTERHKLAMISYNIALELEPDEPAVIYYNMACSASLAGNPSLAYQLLEKALLRGYRNIAHIRRDPDLDNLRNSDARFVDLISRFDTNLTAFERELLGIWQVGSPVMAAAWGTSYAFFPDRVVVFRPGGADCAERLKARRGTWIATNTTLTMVYDIEERLVGGKLVEAVGSCASEYEIEGAKIENLPFEPPESQVLLIESAITSDPESPGAKERFILDGRRLWKMRRDPSDY